MRPHVTQETPPGAVPPDATVSDPVAGMPPKAGSFPGASGGTPRERGVFTTGSTFRHVLVMTATGSVGLVSIFIVDFLNLFYIAQLGEAELAAAIGYAGTILFFLTSLPIGIAIAVTALVSRALGPGDITAAKRLATSGLIYMTLAMAAVSLALLPFLRASLEGIGATGRTLEIAEHFLVIVVPSTPLLALGMALSGILRAAGDARRAMYVTLAGGAVAAVLDPLFIFVFDWGVTGAAIATVLSRATLALIGFHGVLVIHKMVAPINWRAARQDVAALSVIAVPAMLTNVATPVGNAFVTWAIAPFGDSAVAGWAVIGRLIPVAFGAIFALSGAIGPILGQNLGAGLIDRVRRTVWDALLLILAYCLFIWAVLFLSRHWIVSLFDVSGAGADLVLVFCSVVSAGFLFNGALFVANASFNNLGQPVLSTVFNWGRATVGTVPFVLVGAAYAGATGVLIGQALGGIVFGVLAVVFCFRAIDRIARRAPTAVATSGSGA